MEVIGDVVPPGVVNIVNGPGAQIGKALASNKRIAKIGFTGETVTGRLIMSYAAQNLIPSTTELGGKSPSIFFEDVMAADDAFMDKAVEGLVLYAFNKGEVCTCPSRALIHESIYDEFIERCLKRIAADQAGRSARSRDDDRRAGLDLSAREDRELRQDRPRRRRRGADRRQATGPERASGRRLLLRADGAQGPQRDARLSGGDLRPSARRDDVPSATSKRRSRSRTTRCTGSAPASGLATSPARSVWPRDPGRARVEHCYHQYPAHAAFGGYKASGVCRENHRMMLDHYTQTKCLLVSYDPNPLGFF